MSIFENYQEIIPDFSSFQESLLTPIPSHIRINRLKASTAAVIHGLNEKGVDLKRSLEDDDTLYLAPELSSPGNLLEYYLGYIHPQALTSCLTSVVLSPRGSSYVLDMCASPGGKTSHLADLMNNTGLIVANELYSNRHVPLGTTLARLGVLNAAITGYQAQEFPLKQRFDYVLADVPCSGEGRFRKLKERSVYRKTYKKNKLPDLQKKIIVRGFDLLRKNGEMLYATCTYSPEENESVVNFLLQNRDAHLLIIDADLDHEPGLPGWRREVYDKQVQKTARFYPHRVNSVGFFMARIGREK